MSNHLNFVPLDTRNKVLLLQKTRLWLFIWACGLLVSGIAYAGLRHKAESLNAASQKCQQKNDQFCKLQEKSRRLASQCVDSKRRVAELAITDNCSETIALYGACLQSAAPFQDEIRLRLIDITCKPSQPDQLAHPFEIFIEAEAKSESTIAEFVDRLTQDPLFLRVQLKETHRSENDRSLNQSFQIYCETRLEPIGRAQ